MNKIKIKTVCKKMLADAFTPVGIYLNLRDYFTSCLLLESSDYQGRKKSFTYICAQPLASFKVENETIHCSFPDGSSFSEKIATVSLMQKLDEFKSQFEINECDLKFNHNGLFGYMAYESVKYFEEINLSAPDNPDKKIPDMIYHVYKYIIIIDHFTDELYIIENITGDEESSISRIESLMRNRNFIHYKFTAEGDEQVSISDRHFMEMVEKGKSHCRRGDVFQIVLSRSFSQRFKGDDFNVYRALRTINPSPYLFYCDFGNFKIFGSSPEAQIVIENKIASIYPIAGTFQRTGNDAEDALIAERLKADSKENAEHTMLVDLARNDLNRNCDDVKVETSAEIQYYSHVIHLVSKVTGKMQQNISSLKVASESFPAGTLSGAPKHKAMQLINNYENEKRGFYGGCIGYISFKNDYNHAIMIRTFLSKNNKLFYQAGAGIVDQSVPQSELNEVNNKLAALKKAIQSAEYI